MKINIVYWSGTGNTEQMAHLIAEGALREGAEVKVMKVSEATLADAEACDVLLLGCPSMGDEVLEESEFEPYISLLEPNISGKKLGLFGSYGWGDGEWMRRWGERTRRNGGILLVDSLSVNEAPEGIDLKRCRDFGAKAVSYALI